MGNKKTEGGDATVVKSDGEKGSIKKEGEEWVRNQTGLGFFVVKSNDKFEEFYRAQKTCPSGEDEFQECLAAMRRDLPQGFRLNENSPYLHWLKKTLADFGASHSLLKAKSWGAEADTIWQLDGISRWNLVEKEEYKAFHKFLQVNSDLGHISRQELVSMIPVLLLDVEPHHKVLDICASPGSKTKQVLSLMHKKAAAGTASGALPSGVVIANELDTARCDKLLSNVSTVQSPCLMTVNHEGGAFPDLFLEKEGDGVDNDRPLLKFDRIVCDVPCSGDGTIRKNPNVWDGWTPAAGNARHFIQYNIVERAAEMTEVNGLIAYSSCAINPIENEAVLGRLVKLAGGALEIVEIPRSRLPGFRWADGHTQWTVFDGDMNQYDKYEDVPDRVAQTNIHKAMFASNYGPEIHLERCMRLLPHHNDCGGFFVAILRKVAELPWQRKNSGGENTELLENADFLSSRLKRKNKGILEMHMKLKQAKQPIKRLGNRSRPVKNFWQKRSFFDFFESGDDLMAKDLAFYDFPAEVRDPALFYASSSGKDAKVYLTNGLVRRIVEANLTEDKNEVNLFHAGVKVFQKNRKKFNEVSYVIQRTNQLARLMGPARTVEVTPEDVRKLLALEDNSSLEIEALDEAAAAKMKEVVSSGNGVGPIKLVCRRIAEDADQEPLILIGHLGTYKVQISVDKATRYHAKLWLGDSVLSTTTTSTNAENVTN